MLKGEDFMEILGHTYNVKKKRLFSVLLYIFTFAMLLILFSCKQKENPTNQHENNQHKEDAIQAKYKIEHWQENADNDEYTKIEEEEKTGIVGKRTDAKQKEYEGFFALNFNQETINSSGSTIVKLHYKRKIISLILDLNGGSTQEQLEDSGSNTKVLKGKAGAKVRLQNPQKEQYEFDKWKPPLPKHFPMKKNTQIYVATWLPLILKINIKGDERVKITEPNYITVSSKTHKTWKDIKNEVNTKVSLKPEWSNEYYEIYDWKLGNDKGESLLNDNSLFDEFTVYARSNYTKFAWEDSEKTVLKGYEGEKPKGNIIVPTKTIKVETGAFDNCDELTAVDFSMCTELTHVGSFITFSAFLKCKKLKKADFTGCTKIGVINLSKSGLVDIKLSSCTKLRELYLTDTPIENINLSECSNLEGLFLYKTSIATLNLASCKKLNELYLNETKITDIDLSSCQDLLILNLSNTKITSVNLSNCKELLCAKFENCKSIGELDLTNCNRITKIDSLTTFSGCTNATVTLPSSITAISYRVAFGSDGQTYCKKVLVPNIAIKKLVKDTGYPEERIEVK